MKHTKATVQFQISKVNSESRIWKHFLHKHVSLGESWGAYRVLEGWWVGWGGVVGVITTDSLHVHLWLWFRLSVISNHTQFYRKTGWLTRGVVEVCNFVTVRPCDPVVVTKNNMQCFKTPLDLLFYLKKYHCCQIVSDNKCEKGLSSTNFWG